jgi:hypothetical protein
VLAEALLEELAQRRLVRFKVEVLHVERTAGANRQRVVVVVAAGRLGRGLGGARGGLAASARLRARLARLVIGAVGLVVGLVALVVAVVAALRVVGAVAARGPASRARLGALGGGGRLEERLRRPLEVERLLPLAQLAVRHPREGAPRLRDGGKLDERERARGRQQQPRNRAVPAELGVERGLADAGRQVLDQDHRARARDVRAPRARRRLARLVERVERARVESVRLEPGLRQHDDRGLAEGEADGGVGGVGAEELRLA